MCELFVWLYVYDWVLCVSVVWVDCNGLFLVFFGVYCWLVVIGGVGLCFFDWL